MILYLDTSALIKLIRPEEGSGAARDLWFGASARVTSMLTYAEGRAGLAALGRSGRVRAADHAAVRTALDRYWDLLEAIEVVEPIARLAGEVADAHALRGGDAVHLASALLIRSPDLLFATWDRNLARGAAEAGLAVAPG